MYMYSFTISPAVTCRATCIHPPVQTAGSHHRASLALPVHFQGSIHRNTAYCEHSIPRTRVGSHSHHHFTSFHHSNHTSCPPSQPADQHYIYFCRSPKQDITPLDSHRSLAAMGSGTTIAYSSSQLCHPLAPQHLYCPHARDCQVQTACDIAVRMWIWIWIHIGADKIQVT